MPVSYTARCAQERAAFGERCWPRRYDAGRAEHTSRAGHAQRVAERLFTLDFNTPDAFHYAIVRRMRAHFSTRRLRDDAEHIRYRRAAREKAAPARR